MGETGGERREMEEKVAEEKQGGIREEFNKEHHGYGDRHGSTLNPTARRMIHDAVSRGGYGGEQVSRKWQILAYSRTVHKVDSSLE